MSQNNKKDKNKENLEEDEKEEPINKSFDINTNLENNNDYYSNSVFYGKKYFQSKKTKKFKSTHKKQNLEIDNNDINKNLNETSFIDKFVDYFIDNPKKKKKNRHKKDENENFFNLLIGDNEEDDTENNNLINERKTESSINEENEEIIREEILSKKKISIIKAMIAKKENNEWNKYLADYETKLNEEKNIKNKIKNVFNINSDFVVIWKTAFSIFNVVYILIFFLKYIFTELSKKEYIEKETRITKAYHLINTMFLFEFTISILIIMFNGGSAMSYLKLPLKGYNVIPIELKRTKIPFLITKFLRIDLFSRLFSSIERLITENITHYFINYYLRIFINYTNEMFKYLLVYGFYAHCLSCLLNYFGENIDYVSGLYYTMETFTTIGFGEKTPKKIESYFVMILALYLGVAFFAVVTSNIKYLSEKMKTFNRETSFNEQFEFLIFKLQKSTGKVFPSHLKKLMAFYLLFKRGLSFSEIYNEYKFTLNNCRNVVVKKIQENMYEFFKENFNSYFLNCEEEFVYDLYKLFKPKIFNSNKIIINYNENVKELYILISGQVFSYNKNKKIVYTILDSGMFCEYEFITNQRSYEIIKVHPKIPAYGFILRKQDWEIISKKYILSSKNFIKHIVNKKRKHLQWLMSSLNKNNLINDDIIPKKIYKNVNIKNENNVISQKEKEEKKRRMSNKDIITIATKKDIKRNLQKNLIYSKIKEFKEELSLFENSFIIYKKKL